jgi:hypothetical protein
MNPPITKATRVGTGPPSQPPDTPKNNTSLHAVNDCLDAALDYAAGGWAVFPCKGKHPYTTNGFHNASPDADQVAAWWRRWPQANIGAPIPPSLAVIDFDAKNGGLETLRQFEERLGVPETLTTHTGGGGLHLWFLHPGGQLRQGTGILGPGVDTRMPGRGYVLLPPSKHPDTGTLYKWYNPARAAVPMPEWMVDRLRPPAPPPRPDRLILTVSDAYTRAALEGEVGKIAAAPNGTRNNTLHLAACNIGTLVGAGMLDQDTVTRHLVAAGLAAGLEARETVATVASGISWGIDHPRKVAS